MDHVVFYLVAIIFCLFLPVSNGLSLDYGANALNENDLEDRFYASKWGGVECPAWKPFPCRTGGACIPLSYVCDKNDDCPDGYDEDVHMCTAKRRPPADYTKDFLAALRNTFGEEFFEKFFGRDFKKLQPVAIALTGEATVKGFSKTIGLSDSETEHLTEVLKAIINNDAEKLKEMHFKPQEVDAVKLYVKKLSETGFL